MRHHAPPEVNLAVELDPSAFASLVVQHHPRVYRLVRRMCQNPADAEEVIQETLFRAYRGLDAFRGESRFSTWLHQIAVNQVLMSRRASRRRPVEPLDGRTAARATSDEPEAADELVHRKALTERVHAAVAQLEESQRAVIILCDLEERSAADTAGILGVTPETVRQRARRGRLRMRELLGEDRSVLDD